MRTFAVVVGLALMGCGGVQPASEPEPGPYTGKYVWNCELSLNACGGRTDTSTIEVGGGSYCTTTIAEAVTQAAQAPNGCSKYPTCRCSPKCLRTSNCQ